jgi:hypothetical protein
VVPSPALFWNSGCFWLLFRVLRFRAGRVNERNLISTAIRDEGIPQLQLRTRNRAKLKARRELLCVRGDIGMGYAVSWLAIRGNTESSVLASLGLEKTGETEEVPESGWSITRVRDWLVIWSNSCQPKRFCDAGAKLHGEVVMCDVEEHVMFSSVAAFNNGTVSWCITHDAQQAIDHLLVEGQKDSRRNRSHAFRRNNLRV